MAAQVRGEQARERIVEAALEVFLRRGFAGASMDEITGAAGVSKRTVYAHFGDKEALFLAAVSATVEPMQEALQRDLLLADRGDLGETLRGVCRSVATIVVTERVARLRRLVIGEAERFPALAAQWHELGPQQTVRRVGEFLAGVITHADHEAAAEQLMWLCVAPLNRLMFEPGIGVDPAEVRAVADDAADVLTRAWGPTH